MNIKFSTALSGMALVIVCLSVLNANPASTPGDSLVAPQSTSLSDSVRLAAAQSWFNAERYEAAIDTLGPLTAKGSANAKALDLLGLCMARLGYCQQALPFFERAARADSAAVLPCVHAAQSSQQCQNQPATRQYYAMALSRNPHYLPAITELTRILIQDGEPENALATLGQSSPADSANLNLRYLYGATYSALHRSGDAIAAYERALKVSHTYLPALRDLGGVYLAVDSVASATVMFGQALVVQPNDANIKYTLASCWFRRKDYVKARTLFMEIEKPSMRVNALVQAGMCWYFQGSFDTALAVFDSARHIDSTNAVVHFNSGLCLIELKQYKRAIREFTVAIEISRDKLTASAYDRMGTAWLQLNSPKQALAAYTRAIAQDPANERTWFNIGVLYERNLKDSKTALRNYKKALNLSQVSEDPNSLYQKAKERIRFLKTGK